MNETPNNQIINMENTDENDLEFQKNKGIFKNLVKKYLGYRSDGNKLKIHEFLNSLDVSGFNRILNYFEEQRDKTKNFQIKQDLAILYSDILENRKGALDNSRDVLEKLKNRMLITDGQMIKSDSNSGETNKYTLKSSQIEVLSNGTGYVAELNFGDGESQIYHIEFSKDNNLVIKDKFENPLKCNVELKSMDLVREKVGLGQERIINIKEYRVQVGSQYFVLKFND